MERQFEMNQKVKIKRYGIIGYVNGIWESTTAILQYDVEYKSEVGQVCSRWFTGEEIEKVE